MTHIRQRGNTYSYIVHLGTDPVTGKPKKKEKGGFKSPKDAEKAANKILNEFEQGNFADSNEKLKEFIEKFLDSQIRHEVSEATFEMQKGYAVNHIYPIIGNLKLNKITPMHIQGLYSDKLKQGLSAGTIHNIGNFLSKVFRTALEWGYVNKNVMQVVRKPSYSPTRMSVWTKEQSQLFMSDTVDSRFHVVYVLALTTGMRKGEILALQWKHFDSANATLSVQQTIEVTKGNIKLKEPKTKTSRRLITLPQFVVVLLRKHKIQQKPNTLDLITPGIKHILLYPSVLEKVYFADVERLKLPHIRFHDLRHTHATILLSMGENPKVVQERLGHANIATTLNTYSHVLPSMQKNTADKLNDVFTL